MIKIIICNWAGDSLVGKAFVKLGYYHNQKLEINDFNDMFKIAEVFIKEDINIMIIKRNNDEVDYWLCLDNKRFGQRG